MTIKPESIFPDIQVRTKDGDVISLIPSDNANLSKTKQNVWYMVVVYRGQHCPVCVKYLNLLQEKRQDFENIGVGIVSVSADSVAQLNRFLNEDIPDVTFPVFARLKQNVMLDLGLYLSAPTSPKETDHIFSEPATFVINANREVQIVEIGNAPFIRPNLDILLGGLKYTRENDYPIRGNHQIY